MTFDGLKEAQKEAIAAFEKALASGRISRTMGADNYVGDLMYMGRNGGKDHFKHRNTRRYLP